MLGPRSNDARRNLLSNEPVESFWGALWLELWPFEVLTIVFLHFSSFQVGYRHCDQVKTIPCAICHNNNKSACSETPCGSSYGDFCVFMKLIIKRQLLASMDFSKTNQWFCKKINGFAQQVNGFAKKARIFQNKSMVLQQNQ